MAHKLGDNWRSNLIPRPGGLGADGQMDLSKMGNDGKLVEGRHYLQAGGFRRLEGEATGINPVFLTLREFNESNVHAVTFTGQLVYEHPDSTAPFRMVIVGKKRFEIISGLEEELSDQVEQPWILTKP